MKHLFLGIILTFSAHASWEGFDYDSGSYIEIDEERQEVKEGDDVDIYDYEDGEYSTGTVEDISGDEVEVYDYDKEDYRYFEMDD